MFADTIEAGMGEGGQRLLAAQILTDNSTKAVLIAPQALHEQWRQTPGISGNSRVTLFSPEKWAKHPHKEEFDRIYVDELPGDQFHKLVRPLCAMRQKVTFRVDRTANPFDSKSFQHARFNIQFSEGEMHFFWVNRDNKTSASLETVDDAQALVNSETDGRSHCRLWDLVDNHGTPKLVPPVVRTGENSLLFNGVEYRYRLSLELEPTFDFIPHQLFEGRFDDGHFRKDIELKHISTKPTKQILHYFVQDEGHRKPFLRAGDELIANHSGETYRIETIEARPARDSDPKWMKKRIMVDVTNGYTVETFAIDELLGNFRCERLNQYAAAEQRLGKHTHYKTKDAIDGGVVVRLNAVAGDRIAAYDEKTHRVYVLHESDITPYESKPEKDSAAVATAAPEM